MVSTVNQDPSCLAATKKITMAKGYTKGSDFSHRQANSRLRWLFFLSGPLFTTFVNERVWKGDSHTESDPLGVATGWGWGMT